MAALVIALLLALAGALLRTDHLPPPSISTCGSSLTLCPHGTYYCSGRSSRAAALLYMVDHKSLIPPTATTLFQAR